MAKIICSFYEGGEIADTLFEGSMEECQEKFPAAVEESFNRMEIFNEEREYLERQGDSYVFISYGAPVYRYDIV